MDNSIGMAVLKGRHDLPKNHSRVFLVIEFVLNDSVKQLSPSAELKDQVDIFWVLEIVDQSEDVRMVQFHHDLNF